MPVNDSEHEPDIGPPGSGDGHSAVRELARRGLPSGQLDDKTMNEAFRAISKPELRCVLTYLLQSDGEITTAGLVDYVISETTTPGSEEAFRKTVANHLTRSHLPELVETGLIEYNMERQLIRRTELTVLVEPYLEIALAQQSLLAERTGDQER